MSPISEWRGDHGGDFLSFDVHVQRAPVDGEIKFVRYNKGKFLDARNMNASLENKTAWWHRHGGRLSRDGAADRGVDCAAHRGVGDHGRKTGEGRAPGHDPEFGSRVELFLPTNAQIVAKVGDYAKGGETVLAERK